MAAAAPFTGSLRRVLRSPQRGAGLLSAVPCPGEPGKAARDRPDPGKQPVPCASTCCQRWEAGKVMHGLPTSSAAGEGRPGRSLGIAALLGCDLHPLSALSDDLGVLFLHRERYLGPSMPVEHLTLRVGALHAALGHIPLFLVQLLCSLGCWEPFPAAPQPSALNTPVGDCPLLCASPALVSVGVCPQQLHHCHL